jgi:hypothetical protein
VGAAPSERSTSGAKTPQGFKDTDRSVWRLDVSQKGIAAMSKTLKPGDQVEWESSGGHSVGKVVRKQTSPTKIKGHKVAASQDNPEYIVRSDKSGAIAAHKPDALKKR